MLLKTGFSKDSSLQPPAKTDFSFSFGQIKLDKVLHCIDPQKISVGKYNGEREAKSLRRGMVVGQYV